MLMEYSAVALQEMALRDFLAGPDAGLGGELGVGGGDVEEVLQRRPTSPGARKSGAGSASRSKNAALTFTDSLCVTTLTSTSTCFASARYSSGVDAQQKSIDDPRAAPFGAGGNEGRGRASGRGSVRAS